jgi:ferric-dicitrate binding protein FerR (iron transport regulator)
VVDPFERERERERELASAAARKKRSQRRTVVVGLGVTALLAGTITAIVASNEAEADYAQVCFNDGTGERVDDA